MNPGATLSFEGYSALSGRSQGSLTVASLGSLSVNGLVQNGGSILNQPGGSLTLANVSINDSSLAGGGTLQGANSISNTSVSGSFTVNGGTTTIDRIGANATIVTSNANLSLGENDGGNVTVDSGSRLTAQSLYIQTAGSTNIHGDFSVTPPVNLTSSQSSPASIVIAGGRFADDTQTGAIAGNLTFTGSGVGSLTGSFAINGSVTLNSLSSLSGDHTVTGDLMNAGTVSLDRLSVDGLYTQQGTGTLEALLGGQTSPSLDAGSAELGGMLELISENGFDPTFGERFKIVTSDQYSGRFSGVESTGFENGYFRLIYQKNDVEAVFNPVPEPASPWLFLAGSILLLSGAAQKRRKSR